MKHLFIAVSLLGLVSCSNTHNHDVKIMGTQTTDTNDLPFEIDSITTVNQLLDSLNEVPLTPPQHED